MSPRALTLAALLAGCTVAPPDLYPEAARSAADGRLLRALALLEQIPSAHPRRPDCERLTREIDARITRAHAQLGEALMLSVAGESSAAAALLAAVRAEWRDAPGLSDAAAASLASRVPAAPAVEPAIGVVVATQVATEPAATAQPAGLAISTPVSDTPPDLPAPPEVPTEPARASPATIAAVAEPASDDREPSLDPVVVLSEPVDIAMLRGLVHSRDLPAAIARLDTAQRAQPDNQEIVDLLTGLLRKRALAAYGRGWLQAAIDDWARIHDLCPGDRTVSSHLTAARTELARRAFSAPRGRINAGG